MAPDEIYRIICARRQTLVIQRRAADFLAMTLCLHIVVQAVRSGQDITRLWWPPAVMAMTVADKALTAAGVETQ